MDPSVRRAIARIEVTRENAVLRRGTGCLVGHRLLLTALHVVADRTKNPPEFLDGRIEIIYTTPPGLADGGPPPLHRTLATVLDGKWNALEDWVLLTCLSTPHDVTPQPLGTIETDGADWKSYGFPDAEQEGLTIHGTVTNSHGALFGGQVAAYQLYSPEVAAADGLRAKGLSGAPVIVQNVVVGMIRRALLEGEHAGAGTLFASPVSLIAAQCPEQFPDPLQTISPARKVPSALGVLRQTATVLVLTILVALVLWYVYWALADQAATLEDTPFLLFVAGLIAYTMVALRARADRKRRGVRT
jgi:hypothetical protein